MILKTTLVSIVVLTAVVIVSSCKKNVEPPDIQGVALSPIDTSDIFPDRVVLNWTEFSQTGFKAYEVYASQTSNFAPSSQTLRESKDQRDDTSVFVDGLTPSTRYYFKIRVITIDGRYADSNEASAKTEP
jgi:hypothetical protein